MEIYRRLLCYVTPSWKSLGGSILCTICFTLFSGLLVLLVGPFLKTVFSPEGFILQQDVPVTIIAVGRKGLDFMRRYGRDITAEFTRLGDRPSLMDTLPISQIITEDYSNGKIDLVYLAYAQFVSTTIQKPILQQILPVEPATLPRRQNVDYIYEPNAAHVLDALLPRFVEMQVYHAILESIASEQSARVVAMRNATENANEIIQDLTLMYNKARQEAITKELLDITGGAAALAR